MAATFEQSGKKKTRARLSRFWLLVPLLCSMLSACQFVDNDAFQSKRAFELLKQNKYEQAEAIFRQTVFEREKEYHPLAPGENPLKAKASEKNSARRLSTAYYNLGLLYYESGKYGLAEGLMKAAADTYSSYFGIENVFVADAYGLMANSFFKQNKLLEAERYYAQALELKKKLLKPRSLELAVISNNLASIYQKLGDDAEAEKYFRWALNLCQNSKKSEKEQDHLADILNNLALFYEKKEFYSEAKDMVEQALEIENSHKGTVFEIDKVRSLLVLASIEKSTFNLDESEAHYKEALSLLDTRLGGRADLACEVLAKYAEFLYSERKYDEAEPIYARCLKECEASHGKNHPQVAESLSEYAQLLKRKGRLQEAEAFLKRAVSIQEDTIGVDTSEFLATVHRLASILCDQNRGSEADKLYSEILPKLKQQIGPDHPFVADTYDNWAGFLEQESKNQRANELRTQARLIRRKLARSLISP